MRLRLPSVVDQLRDEDILLTSAGLAFYALVSVAPLVVISLYVTSLLVGDDAVRRTGDELARLAPAKLGADRAFVAVANAGTGIGSWALLTAVWPATAYGAGLARAFDRLSGKPRRLRGLRGRVFAFLLLGVLPLFALLGLAVVATGRRPVGLIAGALAGFALLTGLHALVYWAFSPERIAVGPLASAAASSAAAVSVLSVAFAVYLRFGADFEARYVTSGLAAVVLLALWLFLANGFLLVGYSIASGLDRSSRKSSAGPS